MRTRDIKKAASAIALSVGLTSTTSAFATDGYFQHGFGARNKAMAGAGIADGRDATILAINPAGLVGLDSNLTASLSFFVPDRGFVGSGPGGFVPAGDNRGNDTELFGIPNITYSTPIGPNTAFGISLHGNGGLNTDFEEAANPACTMMMSPSQGVFCGGSTGVNLNQAFIAVGVAHDFGGFSLGVSPIFAIQQFEGKGLGAFAGVSSDPANLTNNETDTSVGGGVRIGIQSELSPRLRVAASYQTKIWMSRFEDYAGLFADGGDFDIPQNIQAGVAFDLTPQLTLAFDYRWINYQGVNAVGNATTVMLPFGSPDGPGFGWDDVHAFKLGGEYRTAGGAAFRAGYARNTNPIGPEDVTLNILAPGTIQDHITAGFELPFGPRNSLEASFLYAPESTVSGIEVTPFGPNPNRTIEIGLSELEFTVGWKFKF
ncbi:MAG: outer membrane protein transport protein [Pseudomonadota bacterium]